MVQGRGLHGRGGRGSVTTHGRPRWTRRRARHRRRALAWTSPMCAARSATSASARCTTRTRTSGDLATDSTAVTHVHGRARVRGAGAAGRRPPLPVHWRDTLTHAAPSSPATRRRARRTARGARRDLAGRGRRRATRLWASSTYMKAAVMNLQGKSFHSKVVTDTAGALRSAKRRTPPDGDADKKAL